jgi:L-lactate dehydrogenase complex protein LldE
MKRPEPTSAPRRVQLMATCLCDVYYDDVAVAAFEVLEHLGCSIAVPDDQTCCGQPAFNAGDWSAARRVARHTARVFEGESPVVIPSGSCARMVSHGAGLLFEREPDEGATALASRAWELCDFIVNGLGVSRWPGRFEASVAFHRSCHSRGTAYGDAALTLLGSIDGVRLVEVAEAEQCCGFGGTFSVSFPSISGELGALKLDALRAKKPDVVVSGDMGCLMHLTGLARRQGDELRALHVAQVLRHALDSRADTPALPHGATP